MKKTNMLLAVSALVAVLAMTGCTQDERRLAVAGAAVAGASAIAYHQDGSHQDNFYHYGQNYGEGRNYNYRDGVRDGCTTARTARLRQDYSRFSYNSDYRDGYYAGKRQCKNM